MFCTKCGKEISEGKWCSECAPVKERPTATVVVDNNVEGTQKLKMMIFASIALLTLSNLFVNILEYEILYKDLGFSFFSVISEITEFECLEGTSGAILISMLVLLITGIKLASKAGYALINCSNKDKMKKAYDGLISGCAFWGISCLVTSVVIYFSHTSAIKETGIKSFVSDIEIPTAFIAIYIVAIALAIIIDIDYEKNGKRVCK